MTKTRDLADLGGGFIQVGSGAVQRTVESKLQDVVSVKDFGAVGDGVADDTAAIQAAITTSLNRYNQTVFFPCGVYKVTSLITITQGVMLMGEGSQGSNSGYGTTVVHHSNGGLFLWNGNGTPYAGTGGGLQNFQLLKADGYSGGDAIKILGTSDSQRPGEMVLTNILVATEGSGLWERGLHVDGTACTTPGSKGVRSVVCHKFRVASCTVNDQYVYLNQAVHFSAHHLQIDTGSGTGTAGMTVAGDSDNVGLSNCIINGNLVLSFNTVANCSVFGRVSSLNVTTDKATGVFCGSLVTLVANSSSSTFKVLSGTGIQGDLPVTGTVSATNIGAGTVSATSIGAGTVTSPAHSIESSSTIAAYGRSGSVTQIGQIGYAYPTACQNNEAFSFSTAAAQLFHIATGGGAAALFFADYKSSTISILSNPSSEFENSSTPAAGKTGVYKDPNSLIVSIKNGTGSTVNYTILVVNGVTGTTDPA
jgi:hypothetical protein